LSLVLAACFCSPGAAADSAAPEELQVSVGGFLGSSYSLGLADGVLVCAERRAGKDVSNLKARVAESSWIALRQELDRLNVWAWRESYVDSYVLDGTQWVARIVYGDRTLISRGSNSFPDASGRPSASAEPTVAFQRFSAALAQLAAGCKL
jgi:hypothetical protein